jgi:AmmeMemoRadiSam system protein B
MIHTLNDARQPSKQDTVRAPAVAGRFYPANPVELEAQVRRLLAAAKPCPAGQVRALIAPHAGYTCSGEVAAAAYRALMQGAGETPTAPAGTFDELLPGKSTGNQSHDREGVDGSLTLPALPAAPTVYLLGPAHWRPVDGVGLPRSTAFSTPLGTVPVDVERVTHLLRLGGQYRLNEAAHLPEHGLEVQLPFLQATLGQFAIVPMLFDDGADPERMAGDLTALLANRPRDLVVVSSDLSHYHAYQDAIILDHSLLKAVALGDLAAANAGEACGLLPILCLMRVAQHFGWTPHLCAYANSGDTCGSQREVVGYGAVSYTEN